MPMTPKVLQECENIIDNMRDMIDDKHEKEEDAIILDVKRALLATAAVTEAEAEQILAQSMIAVDGYDRQNPVAKRFVTTVAEFIVNRLSDLGRIYTNREHQLSQMCLRLEVEDNEVQVQPFFSGKN